jgi:hypothetical protein
MGGALTPQQMCAKVAGGVCLVGTRPAALFFSLSKNSPFYPQPQVPGPGAYTDSDH